MALLSTGTHTRTHAHLPTLASLARSCMLIHSWRHRGRSAGVGRARSLLSLFSPFFLPLSSARGEGKGGHVPISAWKAKVSTSDMAGFGGGAAGREEENTACVQGEQRTRCAAHAAFFFPSPLSSFSVLPCARLIRPRKPPTAFSAHLRPLWRPPCTRARIAAVGDVLLTTCFFLLARWSRG